MKLNIIDTRGVSLPKEDIIKACEEFFGVSYFQPAEKWSRGSHPYLRKTSDVSGNYILTGSVVLGSSENTLSFEGMKKILRNKKKIKKYFYSTQQVRTKFQKNLL